MSNSIWSGDNILSKRELKLKQALQNLVQASTTVMQQLYLNEHPHEILRKAINEAKELLQ